MNNVGAILRALAAIGWSVILGVIASLIVVYFVESRKKPSLKLVLAAPSDQQYDKGYPATIMRCLRIRVKNEELPKWLRWMKRESAHDCLATIRFLYFPDGRKIFTEDMAGRWAGSPEATPITGMVGINRLTIWDPTRLGIISKMNIPAGEQEDLDIAVRCDDELDAYGWNNESYQNEWRTPKWKLEKGRYIVEVTVRSAGQKVSRRFLINNDLGREEFRLELL